ncbi:unnamed protein product [Effrenium voratum]|uniref:Ion transport domain-containing protein n=1 Tax=Effrenium voratum TaxID=2562239 RepID=A0AA36JED6_9DINO|nr:unnamed protein product [Effrenium voratum]
MAIASGFFSLAGRQGKPKAQAGVAPPEQPGRHRPAKMSPKLKNNKDSLHLPNAVPKERRDSTESNLEDEMLMDPVMPQGPQKRAKDGWGSEEETEPMAVQTARGGRKSFFQRMHSSLLTHGQEEDDQGALKRMKRGPFYAGEDQDSVILDEEVYDVTNFYKEKGCAQALARSDRFERLTLFVICLNAIYIGVDADNNDAATLIDAAWPYQLCDNLFCIFFTFELAVRFAAFESKRNCIKDMWFVFDSVLAEFTMESCALRLRALNLEPPNINQMKQMAQQRAVNGRILHPAGVPKHLSRPKDQVEAKAPEGCPDAN